MSEEVREGYSGESVTCLFHQNPTFCPDLPLEAELEARVKEEMLTVYIRRTRQYIFDDELGGWGSNGGDARIIAVSELFFRGDGIAS